MSKDKIMRFEDMDVWQEAQDLAVSVYKFTQKFPQSEVYALTSQLRRAASSISANLAEGFGRQTLKDKSHFYHISLGSLLETKNFIYLSGRLSYLHPQEVDGLVLRIESIHRQITAILKFFKDNA